MITDIGKRVDKHELTLWELTAHADRKKLPKYALDYIYSLSNHAWAGGGFNDRTALFLADDVNKWFMSGGWCIPLIEDYMNIEQGLKQSEDQVKGSAERYVLAVQKFRSEIKNDVSSISASASKQVNEIEKIGKAIQNLKESMNSEQMKSAINNAERLAKALESISALQSHSITFAVLDKK